MRLSLEHPVACRKSARPRLVSAGNKRWPSVWQCVVPHDLRERLAPTHPFSDRGVARGGLLIDVQTGEEKGRRNLLGRRATV